MPEAEAGLLAHFRTAADADSLSMEQWRPVLGDTPGHVVKRLIARGLLETPSLIAQLAGALSGDQLKQIAKARGIPHSGTKEKIATRLVQADSAGMEAIIGKRRLLVCSPAALEIATAYRERIKAARAEAERVCLEHLDAGRFREAAMAIAQFEAKQLFARGIGIDWKTYNPRVDVRILELIYSCVPGILRGIRPDAIAPLQRAAAMNLLCGTSRWPGLPSKLATGIHLNAPAASRMCLFFARQRWQLEELFGPNAYGRPMPTRVATVGDSRTCQECAALKDIRFPADKIPEIPHPACTSAEGCRCVILTSVSRG